MLASPDLLCHCIVYLTAQHTDIMPVIIRNMHDIKNMAKLFFKCANDSQSLAAAAH